MKELKAFIRPDRANIIVSELHRAGYKNITVSKAEGTDSLERNDAFPDLHFTFTHSHVVKLEIVCTDECVDDIRKLIVKHGASLEAGSGIIYVSNVVDVYKIDDEQ